MKKMLTVFTPAYNRAYTIHKCYESLKRQTCKDFEWLIIDDGSTDNTKELVDKWMKEKNDFKIRYIYQKNQGMHGAHNTAYENINTELNVCIDSDDYMPDNAVEKIKEAWEKVRGNKKISGLAGLDAYENNEIIGKYICQGAVDSNLIEAFKKLDSNNYHAITDEKLRRYKIAKLHPNEAEILSASILFKERLTIV